MQNFLGENLSTLELNSCLNQMKTSIEQMISFQMVGSLIRNIKQSAFPEPSMQPNSMYLKKNHRAFSSAST